eukprot:scaffold195449_cov22-Tisochrysis_lutea.AAC.2
MQALTSLGNCRIPCNLSSLCGAAQHGASTEILELAQSVNSVKRNSPIVHPLSSTHLTFHCRAACCILPTAFTPFLEQKSTHSSGHGLVQGALRRAS